MNNKEYWQNRNEKLFLAGEQKAFNYIDSLKANYNQAIKQIEKEINAFYGKYATKEGLDITEAKKLLNKSQLKDFKGSLDDIFKFVKKNQIGEDYEKQLRLLRAKSRVSRLEELKANIQFEVEKLNYAINNSMGDLLSQTYEDSYYKTIFNTQKFLGFSAGFAELNTQAINKAITTPYMLENYSQALWKNKNTLLTILNQQIPQGIILGYNPNKVAQIASKKLDSNYKSVARLVRTEYNLILNDGAAKGYIASGIDKYQILATLDSRTSEICQEMDGKIFPVDKREVGISYPPFHPNCRSTTIPYFEPDEFDIEEQRIAKDENGKNYLVPANTTYKQWQEGLVKEKGLLRYKEPEKQSFTFKPAKTIDEVKQRLFKDFGIKDINLGRMKVELANKYLEGFEIFKNKFTNLPNIVEVINTSISANSFGTYTSKCRWYSERTGKKYILEGKPTISVKSPREVDKLYSSYTYNSKVKFQYEKACPESTSAHELTHALTYKIVELKNGFKDNTVIPKSLHLMNEEFCGKLVSETEQKLLKNYTEQEIFKFKKELGTYAFTNRTEMVAQAVSFNLVIDKSQKNIFAKKLTNLLFKNFKEVLK